MIFGNLYFAIKWWYM